MYFAAAQGVGFIAMALGIVSYQCKSTRLLILCQMSGNVAFAVHYLMLGAYAACIGQLILSLSNLLLCMKRPWTRWRGWKWIFSALSLAACFATWKDGFSIIPCAASVISILTNWSFNGKVIRLGKLLLSCPGWIVYDLHVRSYSGILCELIAMGSALVSICRYGISQLDSNE